MLTDGDIVGDVIKIDGEAEVDGFDSKMGM